MPVVRNGRPAVRPALAPTEPTAGLRVEVSKSGKLVLPDLPASDDAAGLSAWLTVVFNRDRAHPITGGAWHGLRGPAGHVELTRRGALSIRFEPAKSINNPARLVETLSWQRINSDGELHAYKGDDCRRIAWVIGSLCDASRAESEADETRGVLLTFLDAALAVEGMTTYGTSAQRFEAAEALRRETDPSSGRPIGPQRYLIDANTGEYVIGVGDLEASARWQLGTGLERGWTRARATALGWTWFELQGHAQAGRAGRAGPHARRKVVRGLLPATEEDSGLARARAHGRADGPGAVNT